jgi:purine nucleosidase
MTMPRKIIVTTDPGQDQAVALFVLLALPEDFDILGVVATAGNIGLDNTQRNARQLLELAGRSDVPVYLGSPRPMRRPLVTAEHVHGPTGLDGVDLPEPSMPLQAQAGVDFIVETLLREPPGSVTLVCLSPLTNLGLALEKEPPIAARMAGVIMMAGAYFEVGNITPAAEFNVYVDPEAADIVLRSGAPIAMLPLDVTHRMLSTRQRLDRFRALGNRCGLATAGMLTFSETFDLKKYGWEGAPLHGPCVPAYMLKPALFESRLINVTVETESALTLGMTVADWWRVTDRPRNVTYVRNGDAAGYYSLLFDTIARLP